MFLIALRFFLVCWPRLTWMRCFSFYVRSSSIFFWRMPSIILFGFDSNLSEASFTLFAWMRLNFSTNCRLSLKITTSDSSDVWRCWRYCYTYHRPSWFTFTEPITTVYQYSLIYIWYLSMHRDLLNFLSLILSSIEPNY